MGKSRESIVYTSKSNSFDKYLAWCDEKSVVAREVKRVLSDRKFNRMLDIGAGDGRLTRQMSLFVSHMTILEPSDKMFSRLAVGFASKKTVLVNKKLEDFSSTTQFDVILASHSIYYLDGLERQFKKIQRLLSPQGIFIIVIKSSSGELQQFMNKFRKHFVSKKYGRTIKTKRLIALLRKVGFDVTEKSVPAVLKIPSVEDAISLLDFFYNIDSSEMTPKSVSLVRSYLVRKFGSGKVVFEYPQTVLITRHSAKKTR